MRKPGQFWSEIRAGRVSLQVASNFGSCGPAAGWLTEIGGHRGNTFDDLPSSRGYKITFAPELLTPTTMSWGEEPTRPSAPPGRSRIRVGHDYRTLPLTTKQRPRC